MAVLGYDTTGDGAIDSFDTNGDGRLDIQGTVPAGREQPKQQQQNAKDGGVKQEEHQQHQLQEKESQERWREQGHELHEELKVEGLNQQLLESAARVKEEDPYEPAYEDDDDFEDEFEEDDDLQGFEGEAALRGGAAVSVHSARPGDGGKSLLPVSPGADPPA